MTTCKMLYYEFIKNSRLRVRKCDAIASKITPDNQIKLSLKFLQFDTTYLIRTKT